MFSAAKSFPNGEICFCNPCGVLSIYVCPLWDAPPWNFGLLSKSWTKNMWILSICNSLTVLKFLVPSLKVIKNVVLLPYLKYDLIAFFLLCPFVTWLYVKFHDLWKKWQLYILISHLLGFICTYMLLRYPSGYSELSTRNLKNRQKDVLEEKRTLSMCASKQFYQLQIFRIIFVVFLKATDNLKHQCKERVWKEDGLWKQRTE